MKTLKSLTISDPRAVSGTTNPPMSFTIGDTSQPLYITDIDGVGPSVMDLVSRPLANRVYEFISSARPSKRSIVLTFGGYPSVEFETRRKALFGFFKRFNRLASDSNFQSKNYSISLSFDIEGKPHPYKIEGYVETVEYTPFSRDIEIVVTIVCAHPLFSTYEVQGGALKNVYVDGVY